MALPHHVLGVVLVQQADAGEVLRQVLRHEPSVDECDVVATVGDQPLDP